MSEVDDDERVAVQIDSDDDDDEKTDEISHLYGEDENGGEAKK